MGQNSIKLNISL